VAQGLRLSNGVVGTTVLRARAAGLDWARVEPLIDEVLFADPSRGWVCVR
jgi:hypothetical protein